MMPQEYIDTYNETKATPTFFSQLLIISALMLIAFSMRCYRITQPTLNFHPVRQYRSFSIARAIYFKNAPSIPQWRRNIARNYYENLSFKEPPIMEYLAAWAYRLAGGELLWIPRIISIVFWLTGGLFLYLLVKEMISPTSAIISMAFYLLAPFGIFMGSSFQPEALMVMAFLGSLLAIWRYFSQPSWATMLIAAVIMALTILIKFIPVFPLAFAFAFLFVNAGTKSFRRWFVDPRNILFILISLLPGISYYCYQTFGPGHLQGVANTIFFPHLLLKSFFWKGWLHTLGKVVGYIALIGGLAGTLLFKKPAKRLLIGLWVGYIIYALLFSYTTATHDYYQVLIFPIVALSLGPVVCVSVKYLHSMAFKWRLGLGIVCILSVIGSLYTISNLKHDQFRKLNQNVKDRLETACRFIGINPHNLKRINHDYSKEINIAKEIGEIVDHSVQTIHLTKTYGKPLEYFGELSGRHWPSSAHLKAGQQVGRKTLSIEERFKSCLSKSSPEYFIITDLKSFEEQNRLHEILDKNFKILAKTDNYFIYDLRSKADQYIQIEDN